MRDDLVDAAVDIGTVVASVVATVRRIEDRLARTTAPSLRPAVADIRSQMARLVGPGFVVAAGAARLHDLLRYLRAIERRLDRLGDSPARDLELMAPIRRLESPTPELASGPRVAGLIQSRSNILRWMLEELRVSQFASCSAPPIRSARSGFCGRSIGWQAEFPAIGVHHVGDAQRVHGLGC